MAGSASTALLASLKELLWKVYELEETVRHGGGPEQQEVLEQRLQALMAQLREASQNTEAFEDLKVPVNLLRHLDEGGFPDQYTADAFKSALADNQACKGKVEAVNSLRSALLEKLAQELPAETQEYRNLIEQHHISSQGKRGTVGWPA